MMSVHCDSEGIAHGVSRANWIGLKVLWRKEDFTTENAEGHGEPRRLFEYGIGAFDFATKSEPNARSATGPASPCIAVVLRVLRGESLRCRPRTPRYNVSRTRINHANHELATASHVRDDVRA
jgi:hypothetical protein